jgi:hypothetical protein
LTTYSVYRKINPGAGFLAGIAGSAAKNEAKIKSDSARDRLERVKAQLDALNYCYRLVRDLFHWKK